MVDLVKIRTTLQQEMSFGAGSGLSGTKKEPSVHATHRLKGKIVDFFSEYIEHDRAAIGCDANEFLPLGPCHVFQLTGVLPLRREGGG
jgi:hypothetical protein